MLVVICSVTANHFLRSNPAFPKGAFSLATLFFSMSSRVIVHLLQIEFSIFVVYIEGGGGGGGPKWGFLGVLGFLGVFRGFWGFPWGIAWGRAWGSLGEGFLGSPGASEGRGWPRVSVVNDSREEVSAAVYRIDTDVRIQRGTESGFV